jgi:hypothetical protein
MSNIILGLSPSTKYELALFWVLFDVFLLLLDDIIKLSLQILESFLVSIGT